ncbi:hypothetical protein [Natrinema marinum]|uniref:hypothetical protein n=1 Tax=Natrinema marinum TaxID=2961598 RepID=UPI0020C8D819|nr:hypothetical protein [Natrinema marinum]
MFRRVGRSAVDLVALVAALFDPFSLYVVLILYWGDLIGETIRRFCQAVVAAPREEYSPTEPPAMHRNGDPNPFRFVTPKLGTVRPVDWLPPIAVHNLKPGVVGLVALSLTALAVGLTTTVLEPPFTIRSWPTIGILAVGSLAIVVKHGRSFRRFVRSDRPPAKRVLPGLQWLGTILMVVPVSIVDGAYADFDPTVGFSAMAVALIAGRITYVLRRSSSPSGADSFERSAPTGRPIERFQTDGHAVRIAGVIDGIVPRLESDVLNLYSRLAAIFMVLAGWFFGSFFVGLAAATVGAGAVLIAVVIGFALAGIAHFEVAFGAMEYRLYDDELVAYDTRLDAVQWRAPLDAIRNVSVQRGFWTGPAGTNAATVTIDRTDLSVEQSPYGFYRQTLVYVETPERVADRLRQETTRRYGEEGPTGGIPNRSSELRS